MKKFIMNEYEKKLLFMTRAYLKVKNRTHPHFKTVKALADFLEVSPKHLWELNKRNQNKGTVIPAKRGPKVPWNKPSKELERIVVFIKRKTVLNNYQIASLLSNKGFSISEKGVGNILKRYPLFKPKRKVIRYEKKIPGELAHIDVHKLKNVKGQNPKEKKYLAALEDDCTRLTYTEMLSDKTAQTLTDFTRRALCWFGDRYLISFKAILSDNGKEFTTHWKKGRKAHVFEEMLREEGIAHKYTRPYRPQTNGKVEAYWKIINKDVFKKFWFKDWDEVKNAYLITYNSKREHGGLNRLTPEEKLIKLNFNNITELIA
jgi:transposase InsO family protein